MPSAWSVSVWAPERRGCSTVLTACSGSRKPRAEARMSRFRRTLSSDSPSLMAMFRESKMPLLTPPKRVVKQWGGEMPSAVRYSRVPVFWVMIAISDQCGECRVDSEVKQRGYNSTLHSSHFTLTKYILSCRSAGPAIRGSYFAGMPPLRGQRQECDLHV